MFPVADDGLGWTKDPWGGELVDGKIYGRGVADMKCGTTASIFTYIYLSRIKDHLKGKLTLTAVSDEETFGPYGARYLMEHHPEVHGDALLNGEPSRPLSVRFGEKGPLWIEFSVLAPGAHGAYTHASKSASKTIMALATELERLSEIKPIISDNVSRAIDAGRDAMDRAMGVGAGAIVDKVTLNVGTIKGGVKVNMVPSSAIVRSRYSSAAGGHARTGLERDREDPEVLPRRDDEGVQLQPAVVGRPQLRYH